jgi:uncharacterized protein (DUF362 family)/Pyruvate/2-oxoacid:ferredoxin oxidoreductase delta subunit
MPTKVSIVKCPDYDQKMVMSSVRRAVNLVGGINAFVKPGERILIKPNLLKARPPETAVTTHPEVVRAVIRLVHDAGAQAIVGDSPGIGDLRRVCESSGILAVVEQEGAVIADFDNAVTVKNIGRFQRFDVARVAIEADGIINLPKFKTHGMTTLTGAVKNLFGCIPGKRKVQWHLSTGVDHASFMAMLVELARMLKPRLTVMDSVVGMEGNGPGSGDPRFIGLIMASPDPVAIDAVCGVVVGVSPEVLPLVRAAFAAGFGESKVENILIRGTPLSEVQVKNFRLPPREHPEWKMPEWVRRTLKDGLTTRPVINDHLCVHCGICQSHCPQKAIADIDDKLIINYRNCIRCFCCQEFCPAGAITVGKGWMLRLTRIT